MRNAINNSSNIIGNSAIHNAACAMVAARVGHTYREQTGKRLTHVDVPVAGVKRPVVSVRGSLCERPETRSLTTEQPTAMWQRSSLEVPVAAWAMFVLNRTTSV